MPATLTSARALRKSLRLPRSFPRVANWLFDEPDAAFHSDAPLLTAHGFTASIAIQVRDQWQNFGNVFDPFQLEPIICDVDGGGDHADVTYDSSMVNPANSLDATIASSSCVCDLDIVFTPVTFVSGHIVVGYTFCSGSSFDREMIPTPQGTFRGRTHMHGRFAYDMDNDHTIVLHHGLTPTVSGIVDITSNGLSRTRCFYSIPNLEYSAERLPLSPLTMVSVTELRTRFENLFTKSSASDLGAIGNDSFSIPQSLPDVRLRDGDIEDNGGLHRIANTGSVRGATVSNHYMKDLMEITSKLNNLSFILEGTYSGSNVYRIIVRNSETCGLRHSGGLFTEHLSLSRSARRECVCHVWQLYTEAAFGMRSERRGAGMMALQSGSTRSKSARSVCRGSAHARVEDTSRVVDSQQDKALSNRSSERRREKKKVRVAVQNEADYNVRGASSKVKKPCVSKRKLTPWGENKLDRMKLSFLTEAITRDG